MSEFHYSSLSGQVNLQSCTDVTYKKLFNDANMLATVEKILINLDKFTISGVRLSYVELNRLWYFCGTLLKLHV